MVAAGRGCRGVINVFFPYFETKKLKNDPECRGISISSNMQLHSSTWLSDMLTRSGLSSALHYHDVP